MAERNLFISFAESDGGHSYLAMRALLNPDAIGHLVFRNTPSEALEAVGANQANLALVPYYNSITQWEGSAVRALATGQFEIKAQICMPTSYVLAAHREHINIALQLYANERGLQPETVPDFTRPDWWIDERVRLKAKEASGDDIDKYRVEQTLAFQDGLKTYTRLLTTIFVGAQADEQYRGRLLRPDMNKVSIELTRNPLRVLEEDNRSDLMKSMARAQAPQNQPIFPQNMSGGTVPIFSNFSQPPLLKDFKGPAALVAKGLMDAPGSQEGWDKQGSLGEMVSLLRKLQVLLDVYSFGPPDLPENKTLYVLLARKGERVMPVLDAAYASGDSPIRVMTLIKSRAKTPARESWINPREALRNKVRRVIFDRPPLMISPPGKTVYLQEGGFHNLTFRDADLLKLGDDLRKAIERKPGDAKPKFETAFLGVYPTCCHSQCKDWLCTAAAEYEEERIPFDWAKFFRGLRGLLPLLLLLLLGLLIYWAYTSYRDYCLDEPDSFWCTFRQAPSTEPPPPPVAQPIETTPPVDAGTPPPATYPTNVEPDHPPPPPPTVTPEVHAPPPPVAGPPPYAPPEPVFKLPFLQDKSSLLRETQNSLRDAAMRALETDRLVKMRIMPLGPPEEDEELYRRRYQAVKDELVRLGVPADRIQPEGTGPNDLIIRQRVLPATRAGRQRVTMELIPDPLAPDDDQ